MKVAVALLGMLSCAAAFPWPYPAQFDHSNCTIKADNPMIVAKNSGSVLLNSAISRYTAIIAKERFWPPADYKLKKPDTTGALGKLLVEVATDSEDLNMETDESYTLDIPAGGDATLKANTVYGAMRGLETFSQLLATIDGQRVVRGTPLHIEDRPALAHRGISLDTARNYYPVSDLKRTLDAMSYNKMNVLHWHVVDAQSWPIESKTYPELQTNGAYSVDMRYSYKDVGDIIKYGRERGIRIIPEFDIPGHTFIVGETFPKIMSCLDKQPNWDKYAAEPPSGQLNIAKPEASEFAIELINEYSKLFTDDVFHLGGDEVNRNCWAEDPDVIEYISSHANATVETLLSDFYTQVHSAVAKQKKIGMSWEETLFHSEYAPPKDTLIQTWIDEQSIPKTVAKGYRSIASPASSYYLDCGHGAWLSNFDGNSWCDPFKSWMHVYNFDPWANVTDPEQQKLIVGAEVALWSEQSDTVTLDNYLWPRAAAMAEVAWSGKTDSTGHVRTTQEVVQRLHDQRFRMVGRGIGAEPLQPLWSGKCDDQRRTLKRRIETLRTLEQEIEELSATRVPTASRRTGNGVATAGALAMFGHSEDWRAVDRAAAEQFGRAPRLTWEMLKKAVAEEDKYQSKKNWSSTKGRGNRKAPVARRLDAEVLKKLGVYPLQQFPVLARCASCSRQINAHFLKEHQEQNCTVSKLEEKAVREEPKRIGVKRAASEMDDAEPVKTKLTKKERLRVEKEKREREREEKREQQRVEKERKKRERDEKRERELAKAKLPLDLDRQCGVVAEAGTAPCTRSLTCKTHSMAMKRAVRGRSNMFDALLQAHLAKSRSAAAAKNAASRSAAKSSNAAAVRNATAIALGGGAGALDESFFDESDQDRGSDSEAEMVIDGIRCSYGRPLAVRPALLPRRRHHYLRVRDLFYDALRPAMGSDAADGLTL
ncbi:Glucosamine-6-phosphate isomerase (Glucosamine-6-phosphate deaminase) (GNPDA) (GlcN6P deaminase) [Coemansia sp. RSA 2131]|nr:Glucosamine-6-phosphate isomerase (Glucosamine-6-phosphate deaminase) (GNPDA) (GlcN6P deaminase) [Coemansia sp. RSA 2131]